MSTSPSSSLALVELADVDHLLDRHGPAFLKSLQNVFVTRLKAWIRVADKSKLLDNNRVCVVLKGISSPAEVELAAAKLARLFEEPHYILEQPVQITVTAGFTKLDGPGADIKIALRQADKALRRARKLSRRFEIFGPDCQDNTVDERELVLQIEEAVERGEMHLYYQPKLHAGFRTTVGAEALIRWHTKDRKVLLPDKFIGVAERNKVIQPLSWWVIKSAVARLGRWEDRFSISVNVPPTLLMDDEILAVVRDALDIHGVDAQRLTLEVTESIMADNPEIMLDQLVRLRDIGVKISIDDFGTGFSSLAYFRDLPADEIKIDKCFVMPMLNSKKDEAIVKAVIDLAHNFSLRVVAEGVESEAIATRLGELGCDILQGYAFDAALPIEDFEMRYLV